jgi:hypothetical protein
MVTRLSLFWSVSAAVGILEDIIAVLFKITDIFVVDEAHHLVPTSVRSKHFKSVWKFMNQQT